MNDELEIIRKKKIAEMLNRMNKQKLKFTQHPPVHIAIWPKIF
ncbi:MAG: hypothetical protein AB1410_00700 [Acidobacteriota bacterium]